MAVDDSNTKSLLHFDGADHSTVYTDESGKTWEGVGTVEISTGQSKFGGASLLAGDWDEDGGSIKTTYHADFIVGTGDFCVDLCIRPDRSAGWQGFFQIGAFARSIQAGTGSNINTIKVRVGGVEFVYNIGISFTGNNWYHFELNRASGVLYAFLNGTELQTSSWPTRYASTGDVTPIEGDYSYIAYSGYYGFLSGNAEEFRFSSVARHTSDFTPPTGPYEPAFPIDLEDSPFSVQVAMPYDIRGLVDIDLADAPLVFASSISAGIVEAKSAPISLSLPAVGVSINGVTGLTGKIEASLPLLAPVLNGLVGPRGQIEMTLPLLEMSLFSGGFLGFSLPLLSVQVTAVNGAVGSIQAVLPGIRLDLSGRSEILGKLDINLPVILVSMAGIQHGSASINLTLPSLGFSGNSLLGSVGQIAFDLPLPAVNLVSRQNSLAHIDIVLPALTVNLYGQLRPVALTFKAVVINTKNFAVTEYEGLEFNSLASIGNVHLGANENGIYALRGSRMGGDPINSRIASGLLDFGQKVLSPPRDIWLSLRADGKLILNVRSEKGIVYPYDVSGLEDALHEERVKLGRGLKERFYDFYLSNVAGADFDLSGMSIMADVMRDRKR